jgi:2-dehydro-3-deoxygluconokinase
MPTKNVVAFGELMLRLKSPGFERLLQSPLLEATFGGGEANVLVSLSNYGLPTEYVSLVPDNAIGLSAIHAILGKGVGVKNVIKKGERLGIYFLEAGANQRPSKVVYDRSLSSIAEVKKGDISWSQVFEDSHWFHFTGITPALSSSAADVCKEAVAAAKRSGVTVSCDLNYRAKLWKYGKKASEIMREIVRDVDVIIANEEDCQQALGIKSTANVHSGEISLETYLQLCEQVLTEFPNVKKIAVTLRESKSASRNGWSACLHNRHEFFTAKRYEIENIVDRVGTGDSFAGGLIYGLIALNDDKKSLEFATAAACLKHSIPGDFNNCSIQEVLALMQGEASGRVQR